MKAPKSYVNRRRPPLGAAMLLEDTEFVKEAIQSLRDKGYFTPPPRPWQVGACDRGAGRLDPAVLDKFGDVVAKVENVETAELIVLAVNTLHGAKVKKK